MLSREFGRAVYESGKSLGDFLLSPITFSNRLRERSNRVIGDLPLSIPLAVTAGSAIFLKNPELTVIAGWSATTFSMLISSVTQNWEEMNASDVIRGRKGDGKIS